MARGAGALINGGREAVAAVVAHMVRDAAAVAKASGKPRWLQKQCYYRCPTRCQDECGCRLRQKSRGLYMSAYSTHSSVSVAFENESQRGMPLTA